MIVTLAEMKEYLGITDATYDDYLTQQLTMVNSAIENYCGRKFDEVTYTQEFYRDDSHDVSVPDLYTYHYPISSVASIQDEDGADYTEYRLAKRKGKLTKECGLRKDIWFRCSRKLTVVYTAGYDEKPEDLKQVVYSLVSESYNKKLNGIDVGFGSDVQRISVAGVMSIDFDYTLQKNERSNAFGMIIGNWANVLDHYRSERVLTGEIWEEYVS